MPGRALVFGIGPTVHHMSPLAPHALETHVADYLKSNLEHVRRRLPRCKAYHVGQLHFACVNIDEHDLANVLRESGVDATEMHFEVRSVDLPDRLGYESIVLAAARAARTRNQLPATASAPTTTSPADR